MNRLVKLILTALNSGDQPLNSRELAARVASSGVSLSERTIRYYLQKFDADGLTEGCARRGRRITEKGRQELTQGFVSERVGFIINRINNLAFRTDFDPLTGKGKVILNISFVSEERLPESLEILQSLLHSPYALSNRIALARSGESLGDLLVPDGLAAVGTLCSITLNGILLRSGIPVTTKFGGIVEIRNSQPVGFSSAISYEGSSIPPLEILIRGRMTDVLGALNRGTGKILGSFREIPAESIHRAKEVNSRIKRLGFSGCTLFGQPGEPLLGLPVPDGKVGLVVLGGLNPVAGLEEAGLAFDSFAMTLLRDYEELIPLNPFAEGYGVAGIPPSQAYSPFREPLRNLGAPPV